MSSFLCVAHQQHSFLKSKQCDTISLRKIKKLIFKLNDSKKKRMENHNTKVQKVASNSIRNISS